MRTTDRTYEITMVQHDGTHKTVEIEAYNMRSARVTFLQRHWRTTWTQAFIRLQGRNRAVDIDNKALIKTSKYHKPAAVA